MNDRTWTDIEALVDLVLSRESVVLSVTQQKLLADMAIDEISDTTKGRHTSWSVAGGELTIVSNTCVWPNDVIRIDQVYLDGEPLTRRSISELDRFDPDWRTLSGVPEHFATEGRVLYFDRIPSITTFEAYGRGTLPHFSDGDNPLTDLPIVHQMLPAYYILANAPVHPKAGIEMARAALYQEKYQAGLSALTDAVHALENGAYSF